jgi:hypothetical protein
LNEDIGTTGLSGTTSSHEFRRCGFIFIGKLAYNLQNGYGKPNIL